MSALHMRSSQGTRKSAFLAPAWHSVWTREPSVALDAPINSFEELLEVCCCRVLADKRFATLAVRSELVIEGVCPLTHQRATLRVVDELVSNAMEHAFYGRSRGRLLIRVVCRPNNCVDVSVSDDGWGFDDARPTDGNGFRLLREIGSLRRFPSDLPFRAGAAVSVLIPIDTFGRPPPRT